MSGPIFWKKKEKKKRKKKINIIDLSFAEFAEWVLMVNIVIYVNFSCV